jgi:hypothetical protein
MLTPPGADGSKNRGAALYVPIVLPFVRAIALWPASEEEQTKSPTAELGPVMAGMFRTDETLFSGARCHLAFARKTIMRPWEAWL